MGRFSGTHSKDTPAGGDEFFSEGEFIVAIRQLHMKDSKKTSDAYAKAQMVVLQSSNDADPPGARRALIIKSSNMMFIGVLKSILIALEPEDDIKALLNTPKVADEVMDKYIADGLEQDIVPELKGMICRLRVKLTDAVHKKGHTYSAHYFDVATEQEKEDGLELLLELDPEFFDDSGDES